MSIMIAEVYKALVEAGASEDSARAEDLATKEDLADVRAALTHDIADLRAEVKQDIAGVKQETADLKSDLKIMKFVYGPAVLLMLAKLVFFP